MKFKINRVTLSLTFILLVFISYPLLKYLSTFFEYNSIIFMMNFFVISIASYFVVTKIIFKYLKYICEVFLLEENNFTFDKLERYRLLLNVICFCIIILFCHIIYYLDYDNVIDDYVICMFFISQLMICFFMGMTFTKRFKNKVKGYNYEKISEQFNPLDQIAFNVIDAKKWYDFFIYEKVIDTPYSNFEKLLVEKSVSNKISIIDIKGLKNRNKQITYTRIIKFLHEELIQGGIDFSYDDVFLKQYFLHWICENFTKGGVPITYKKISSAYNNYFHS